MAVRFKNEKEGGKIMPKGKGTKVFVTMILLALALTLILPTVASAACQSNDPWRGELGAAIFVYGKAEMSDTEPHDWMRVTVRLYEKIGWWWSECASAVNEENGDVYYCDATASAVKWYNQFKVKGLHEWQTGDVYDHDHTASSAVWC
jgi:hypothetical protein